jgi:hypothetical protein
VPWDSQVIRRLKKKAEDAKARKRRRKTFWEPLEHRLLLDAVTAHWIGESGSWSDPANWDIGVVPNDG